MLLYYIIFILFVILSHWPWIAHVLWTIDLKEDGIQPKGSSSRTLLLTLSPRNPSHVDFCDHTKTPSPERIPSSGSFRHYSSFPDASNWNRVEVSPRVLCHIQYEASTGSVPGPSTSWLLDMGSWVPTRVPETDNVTGGLTQGRRRPVGK